MSEVSSWGIIGPGHVGGEITRQINQEHVAERLGLEMSPRFVMRSSGIYYPDSENAAHQRLEEIDDFPDVTFLAMPTTDDGAIAHGYLEEILSRGKLAVTAEKGALANYFEELKETSDDFNRLGYNASVGGGTHMIEAGKQYTQDKSNVTQIHLALNGTLSAIFSQVGPLQGSGNSLGQAVTLATKLDYAEPGAESPYKVIKAEAEGDIPKKTSIFFNSLGLGEEVLDWKDLKFELDDEEIAQAVEEAKARRFIVSIYSTSDKLVAPGAKYPEGDIIGGFDYQHEDWQIVGGFRNVNRNPLFSNLADASGPLAGFVIGLGPNETDGIYSLTGPGAGVSPTANAMIDDYVVRKQR